MLYLQSKTKQKSNHNACAHLLKLKKTAIKKWGLLKKVLNIQKKITSSPCLQKINTTIPPP